MAGTVDAFEADIMMQPRLLESAVRTGGVGGLLHPPIPPKHRRRAASVFCGSGDSLAASMLAESMSGMTVRAADPAEVASCTKSYLGGGGDTRLYVVSISGSTAAGIRAAQSIPGAVAVTADAGSRLARACSETVILEYPSSGVTTAGSIGFLASALACMSLAGGLGGGDDGGDDKTSVVAAAASSAASTLDAARRDASRFAIPGKGRTFVLGDRLTYPVSAYCAAKFSEVLGAPCQYERTEQFSHAGMFSARPGDTVVILEESGMYNRRLAAGLEGLGLGVIMPDAGASGACAAGASALQRVLYMIFFSQFLALNAARSAGLDDCHFVSAKAARDASSAMIYGGTADPSHKV